MNSLKIVLSGATGGIGQCIAKQLADAGHRLVLLGRNDQKLSSLAKQLPGQHQHFSLDLRNHDEIDSVCQQLSFGKGIDALINNAGLSCFGDFRHPQMDPQALMEVNLLAPIRLCQGLMPSLLRSEQGCIINIGSSFGSIGYPGFSLYCASKFGLRGFTEALQREFADHDIAIHYLAPRAVNTEMNSPAVNAMNKELGNQVDEPDVVAQAVAQLLGQRQSQRRYLGWPEKLFVRLNALLPALVGKALSKQLPIIRRYSHSAETSQ